MSRYDLLVVGAGLAGSVIAERAATLRGWRVLVIESRDEVGGNAADRRDEHGVMIHSYGPHIFHTNCRAIWEYLSQYTDWHPYTHTVRAMLPSGIVPIPVNFNTLDALYSPAAAAKLKRELVACYSPDAEIGILDLAASQSRALRSFAEDIYEKIFLEYTVKQWGMRPEELDRSVSARVPIRLNRDDRYFTDTYQAVPEDGYTALVGRILDHPLIDVALGQDYHRMGRALPRRVAYTGPIDRYFDYQFGALPYRSLKFEFVHSDDEFKQEAATITYPSHPTCTRSCEYKRITGQAIPGTTRSFEYPVPHVAGETTPYYPMPMATCRDLYRRYADKARKYPHVTFCGRLARYQYLNMDQAVAQALKTSAELLH